ncbi:hypothetical protein EDC01DRAFT_638521 [Geopyxis carbonaria]|nr:hypothetical protein EDC01DRAFT_638521 [Geopyxis carbonaria]
MSPPTLSNPFSRTRTRKASATTPTASPRHAPINLDFPLPPTPKLKKVCTAPVDVSPGPASASLTRLRTTTTSKGNERWSLNADNNNGQSGSKMQWGLPTPVSAATSAVSPNKTDRERYTDTDRGTERELPSPPHSPSNRLLAQDRELAALRHQNASLTQQLRERSEIDALPLPDLGRRLMSESRAREAAERALAAARTDLDALLTAESERVRATCSLRAREELESLLAAEEQRRAELHWQLSEARRATEVADTALTTQREGNDQLVAMVRKVTARLAAEKKAAKAREADAERIKELEEETEMLRDRLAQAEIRGELFTTLNSVPSPPAPSPAPTPARTSSDSAESATLPPATATGSTKTEAKTLATLRRDAKLYRHDIRAYVRDVAALTAENNTLKSENEALTRRCGQFAIVVRDLEGRVAVAESAREEAERERKREWKRMLGTFKALKVPPGAVPEPGALLAAATASAVGGGEGGEGRSDGEVEAMVQKKWEDAPLPRVPVEHRRSKTVSHRASVRPPVPGKGEKGVVKVGMVKSYTLPVPPKKTEGGKREEKEAVREKEKEKYKEIAGEEKEEDEEEGDVYEW